MAKKNYKKEPIQQNAGPAVTAPTTQNFRDQLLPKGRDLIPFLLCILYFVVEFLPGFGGMDDMGMQWIFVVLLDFVGVIYILDRKHDFDLPAANLFKNTFSRLYLALFALAGISVFYAINHAEGWVCYVRFIATIVAYFNIAILLYNRLHLFRPLAMVLGLVLLVQSFQALSLFFGEMGNYPLTGLVVAMKAKAGNKNIFSATLVAKVPFVLYLIYSSKQLLLKVFNIGILILAVLTIFIVNSRTAYLALILELVLFMLLCLRDFLKPGQNRQQILFRLGLIIVPVVAAFFMSMIAISAAKSRYVDEQTNANQFGSVTERLSGIGSIAASGDGTKEQRFFLWGNAVDYIKTDPWKGCGYGNWKIASIPFIKYLTDDLSVPIHAHNDILEFTAELGIGGGLLYLSLFICLLFYTVRIFFSKADDRIKLVAFFSFAGLAGYFVDAFFNFPNERPINQLFLVLFAALNVVAFYAKKAEEKGEESKTKKETSNLPKSVFALTAMLLLLPSAYITYLTYQSLVIQNKVIPDLNNEPLKIPIAEVIHAFPSIPNISSSSQPIEAILGRYLYEAKRYPESIAYLDRGAKANPYIMYSEFLKADVYYAANQMDSAFKYATLAYYTKPRAKTYFQTLVAVCARRIDTVTLTNAFRLFTKYRSKEAFGYNFYLMGMLNAKGPGKATPQLLALADSVVKVFPTDKDILLRRTEIFTNMPASSATGKVISGNDVILSNQLFNEGNALFTKGDFAGAAQKFIRSSQVSNGSYGVYENIAICYFNMKDWAKSIPYFDRVIAMKTATDGKSEYFKGAALINLGRKDEACPVLKVAKAKNYPGTDALITSYCGQ